MCHDRDGIAGCLRKCDIRFQHQLITCTVVRVFVVHQLFIIEAVMYNISTIVDMDAYALFTHRMFVLRAAGLGTVGESRRREGREWKWDR